MAGFFGGITAKPVEILVSTAFHPLEAHIAAAFKPWDMMAGYRAWRDNPFLLPDPSTLIELANRGMVDLAFAQNACRMHGVNFGLTSIAGGFDLDAADLWRRAGKLKQEVLPVDFWREGVRRGFIDREEADPRVRRAGGDPEWFFPLVPWDFELPGVSDILDSLIRGRIGEDEANLLMARAGAKLQDWQAVLPARQAVFGPTELIALRNREHIDDDVFARRLQNAGFADPSDRALWDLLRRALFNPRELLDLANRGKLTPNEMQERFAALGFVADDRARWEELQKGLPGVADLNMFGIRHSWQPELVERYGYYLEFPERLREWYRKLGLDYPIGFQAVTDKGLSDLMLSDAYWAAHWHVLPLNAAFQAYQRFPPDLVRRFQKDNPNLQPFTRDDLNIHMRQADFPPGVREWLTALAHPVLGRRDINWGKQFLNWDRGEMQSRFRLLGYTTDDAAALAQIAEAREAYRSQAWLRSVETRANQQTVRMIEGLYTDGTIDRPFALRQLSDAGLSAVLSSQLLDIADFSVERSLVRAAVTATNRDYLSGVLSRAEAETQLRRIGIQDARVANYLAAWSIQRSARRKRLETAKVAGMVTAGLLGPDEARARLANLQWSDPDATLLLAEAEGKLAKRLAGEEKSRETDARRRAKELERLAKDADAQSRKLRAEANRIAPRSSVTAWLRDGIIDDDTFRRMLRERGYDDESIERYLKDAKQPKPRPPRPSPTTPPWPKPAGSAHPAQARLLRWYNDGVISLEDYRDGLTDLGYAPGDVANYVRDAAGARNGSPPAPTSG